VNNGEPPSCTNPSSPLFLVGKDSHGCWVVKDKSGLRGGLFRGRAEAMKFAMFENGHRPNAVIMVPEVLELDMSAPRQRGNISMDDEAEALLLRRVA
jgi:hypothetical protein